MRQASQVRSTKACLYRKSFLIWEYWQRARLLNGKDQWQKYSFITSLSKFGAVL